MVPSRPKPGAGRSADTFCRKLLAEKENSEALTWLKQSRAGDIRTLGEQNPSDSLKMVEEIYNSGAIKANIIDIERVAGYGETSNVVCVEMPAAPEQRRKLFQIESRMATSAGFDPVADDGQTYLFLSNFKLSFGQMLRAPFHF